MSIKSLTLAGLLAVAFATGAAADDRYVIVMTKNAIPKGFDAKVTAAGGTIVRKMPEVGLIIATSSSPAFSAAMRTTSGVSDAGIVGAWTAPEVTMQVESEGAVDAAPDTHATLPTAADDLYNAGMVWGVNRVHGPQAWSNGNIGSHNTVVAVIDTGVAWTHPDLAPNVVHAACVASTPTCNPYPSLSFHGTHVAGTVAAAFGHSRVVGVAPNVGLASYNIFENITGCGVCAFSDSRWVAMIDAANNGFEVESMSLGGYVALGGQGSNETSAYIKAEKKVANYVKQQGTLMVASAGNESVNVNGGVMHVPGDIPQMVNVSATGIQPIPRYPATGNFDILAFYSNYGGAVDITAPGGDCGEISDCQGLPNINGFPYFHFFVLSTGVNPNPVCAATASCPLNFIFSAGTSMATPLVSGVAALIYDANPGITPDAVKNKLKATAEVIGGGQSFGAGMVRADNATN